MKCNSLIPDSSDAERSAVSLGLGLHDDEDDDDEELMDKDGMYSTRWRLTFGKVPLQNIRCFCHKNSETIQ